MLVSNNLRVFSVFSIPLSIHFFLANLMAGPAMWMVSVRSSHGHFDASPHRYHLGVHTVIESNLFATSVNLPIPWMTRFHFWFSSSPSNVYSVRNLLTKVAISTMEIFMKPYSDGIFLSASRSPYSFVHVSGGEHLISQVVFSVPVHNFFHVIHSQYQFWI